MGLFESIFKKHNILLPILLDFVCVFFSIFLLFQLDLPMVIFSSVFSVLLYVLTIIFLNYLFGIYKIIIRYTSLVDLFKIILCVFLSTFIFGLLINANTSLQIRYLTLIFYFTISTLTIYRVFIQIVFKNYFAKKQNVINCMIFGAGINGINIFRGLKDSGTHKIIAFIDDNLYLQNKTIEGVKVYKFDSSLKKIAKSKNVRQLIISTNKINPSRKHEILGFFSNLRIRVTNAPLVENLTSLKNIKKLIKPIRIEDLLARNQIEIDIQRNKDKFNDQVILVTGAAGSIGSEIVKQILKFKPKKLILLDVAETPLFNLQQEIKEFKYNTKIEVWVDTILNKIFLRNLFNLNNIGIVFHAAAYKHVTMLEFNPKQAILNNVLGSKNILDLSVEFKIQTCVFVSTDKAVNPTNIMGASKRIVELYLAGIKSDDTNFVTTRFGNVLGSNGSVVPIFEKQILNGGPVLVTDPEVTRYFMTIPEASQLVLEASSMSTGNEIFVFDMGNPVKIKDLALNMIRLSGFHDDDIKIEYTGLRPGEKLYEELLTNKESLKPSHNPLIFIAKRELISKNKLIQINKLIKSALENVEDQILVKLMKEIVPEFKSMNSKYEKLDN